MCVLRVVVFCLFRFLSFPFNIVYIGDLLYYRFRVAFWKTITVGYSSAYFDANFYAFISTEQAVIITQCIYNNQFLVLRLCQKYLASSK